MGMVRTLMLTYVDGRLKEWAMWKAGAGGRGYDLRDLSDEGGRSCFESGPVSYVPVDDLRCAEVDRCVCALNPVLREAVEETYLRLGTTEQAAENCNCGRVTLWRRVGDAHALILGYLNDMAAGVPVKPWEERRQAMGVGNVRLISLELTA